MSVAVVQTAASEKQRSSRHADRPPTVGGEDTNLPHSTEPLSVSTPVITAKSQKGGEASNDYNVRRAVLHQELLRSTLGAVLILLLRVLVALSGGSAFEQGLAYLVALLSVQISIVVVVLGASSLFADAWRDLRSRVVSPAACELLAVVLLCATHVYALFFEIQEYIAQPLYSSVPAVMVVLTLLRLVECEALERAAKKSLVSLAAIAPYVRLTESGGRALRNEEESAALRNALAGATGEQRISSGYAKPGDAFEVRAGEVVPLDGEITEGSAEVNERHFGGAPRLKFKSSGQQIFAGSLVRSGSLQVRAAAAQEDAVHESFLETLRASVAQSSESDRRDGVMTACSLTLIFLAASGALFWNERGATFSQIGLVVSAILCSGLVVRAQRLLATIAPLALTTLFLQGATLKCREVLRRMAALKNLVLDYEAFSSARSLEMLRLEVIDERIDLRSLISVLLTVLGDGDDEFSYEAVPFLRKKIDQPMLFQLSGYRYYAEKGIIGVVQGADFSIGNEEFLVERGVQLQTSDLAVLKEGEESVYVAMGDEVVARFILKPLSRTAERHFLDRLNRLGIRALLCGPEPVDKVDTLAKEIGIELPSAYGGLSGDVYKEKVLSWKPVGFYSNLAPSPSVAKLVDVTISHFDELHWNTAATDIVLYSRGVSGIALVAEVCRRAEWMRALLWVVAILVTLTAVVAAFIAILPPAAILVTLLAVYSATVLGVFTVAVRCR